MKKTILTLMLLLFSLAAISQTKDTSKICCYSVQLFSTTIYPYPFEGDFYQVVEKDSMYTEMVKVGEKIHHRYLVKCNSLMEANQILAIVRQRYTDAFIVYYYSNGERFN
jgi:hypothetical protein